MGVNGQKRKKKQPPVPSLEETLPKKFKSDKPAKPRKREDGVKIRTKPTSNGVTTKSSLKEKKLPKEEKRQIEDESEKENSVEEHDFGATKASLFDDIEEEDDVEDEFAGIDNMYLTPNRELIQGR
jgi:transcriptional/translational regulatory protein YebC/TACO1